MRSAGSRDLQSWPRDDAVDHSGAHREVSDPLGEGLVMFKSLTIWVLSLLELSTIPSALRPVPRALHFLKRSRRTRMQLIHWPGSRIIYKQQQKTLTTYGKQLTNSTGTPENQV